MPTNQLRLGNHRCGLLGVHPQRGGGTGTWQRRAGRPVTQGPSTSISTKPPPSGDRNAAPPALRAHKMAPTPPRPERRCATGLRLASIRALGPPAEGDWLRCRKCSEARSARRCSARGRWVRERRRRQRQQRLLRLRPRLAGPGWAERAHSPPACPPRSPRSAQQRLPGQPSPPHRGRFHRPPPFFHSLLRCRRGAAALKAAPLLPLG